MFASYHHNQDSYVVIVRLFHKNINFSGPQNRFQNINKTNQSNSSRSCVIVEPTDSGRSAVGTILHSCTMAWYNQQARNLKNKDSGNYCCKIQAFDLDSSMESSGWDTSSWDSASSDHGGQGPHLLLGPPSSDSLSNDPPPASDSLSTADPAFDSLSTADPASDSLSTAYPASDSLSTASESDGPELLDIPHDWELEGSIDSGLDWSCGDSPASNDDPELGNKSMGDYRDEDDLVWRDRGEVDGVRMGVLVPIHPWMLRLHNWEGFGVVLLMNMMQEYWDTAFPTIAPVSTFTMWGLRRNMLDRLGLPH